jgi:antitoxin YobK
LLGKKEKSGVTMSLQDLYQAIQLINSYSETAHFDGPKPESLIVKAETALGLTLPTTYRLFLAQFGCGAIAGSEFYGVVDDDFVNSSVPDAIWLAVEERRYGNVPSCFVLIASTGDGGYCALDCSAPSANGEAPVVE